jgi:hypothetical protein
LGHLERFQARPLKMSRAVVQPARGFVGWRSPVPPACGAANRRSVSQPPKTQATRMCWTVISADTITALRRAQASSQKEATCGNQTPPV